MCIPSISSAFVYPFSISWHISSLVVAHFEVYSSSVFIRVFAMFMYLSVITAVLCPNCCLTKYESICFRNMVVPL